MLRNKSLVLTLFFFITLTAKSQQIDIRIASMYVINFAKYIEWPAGSIKSSFVIGVVGNPKMVAELNTLTAGRTIENKPIVIKDMSTLPIAEVKNCQILIFDENSLSKLKNYQPTIAESPMLIITEKDFSPKKGVGINIILDEDDDYKTKFQLNKTAIESRGMKVSSQLQALAKK
jgi:hypothetical protein